MSTRKARVGETIRRNDESAEVLPGCDGTVGGHFCAGHPDAWVANNMTMNGHIEGPGQHIEVWICASHGPEVP